MSSRYARLLDFEGISPSIRHRSHSRIITGLNRFDFLAFLAPTCAFIQFDVVGRLYLSEIILIVSALVLLQDIHRAFGNIHVRITVLLGLLWLVNQVSTDLIRDVPFKDYARNWSKISVFLVCFLAIYVLVRRARHGIISYALGIVSGGLLTFFVSPDENAIAHPWKFGVSIPANWVFVLLATWIYHKGYRPAAALLLTLSAALDGYMDHRSMAGVCALAAALIALEVRSKAGYRVTMYRRIQTVFALIAVGYLYVVTFGYLAGEGVFGDAARQRYAAQSAGDYGVLIGGRGVVFEGLVAIVDSPLLGQGSWTKNDAYVASGIDWLRELGYTEAAEQARFDPQASLSHSYVIGSWVEGGLFGGVFWIWVAWFTLRRLVTLYLPQEGMAPIIMFVGLLLLWDVGFSPFAGYEKFIAPFYLVIVIVAGETRYTSESALMTRQRRKLPILKCG